MTGGEGPQKVPLSVIVEAKGKTCYIAVTGHISEWSKSSAGTVLKDIKAAKEGGAKACEIYVNSRGGNVFEANEILNLIEDNFDENKITVRVGALCASAGTIFPAKYHATGKRNTQCMIHKPSMYLGGNEDEIEANLKLLKDLTKQYKAMYAKKFGIKEKEVEALWEKGDYWMNAQAAKKMGLLDEVESDEEKIDATTRLQMVACGAPHIPEITNTSNTETNPKPIRMELAVLAVSLGLEATATQAVVDAKIRSLKAQAARVDAVEQSAKDKEKAEKSGKIKAVLDAAEKDKKIDATMRGNYEAIGENNLDQLEAILKTMTPIVALSGKIKSGAKGDAEVDANTKDWTYADWQEKNREGLLEMNEKEPEKFEALSKVHYKEN